MFWLQEAFVCVLICPPLLSDALLLLPAEGCLWGCETCCRHTAQSLFCRTLYLLVSRHLIKGTLSPHVTREVSQSWWKGPQVASEGIEICQVWHKHHIQKDALEWGFMSLLLIRTCKIYKYMQIYNKTTLNVPAEILEVIPVPANISGDRRMLLYFNIYKNRNI